MTIASIYRDRYIRGVSDADWDIINRDRRRLGMTWSVYISYIAQVVSSNDSILRVDAGSALIELERAVEDAIEAARKKLRLTPESGS